MIVLDTNILLYAHIPAFPQHKAAFAWLEETLSAGETVIGIPWQVATSFIRLVTNRRVFDVPFDIAAAKESLDAIFDHPMVEKITPTERHWEIYSKILIDENLTGDVVMDAHIAAIAIEYNASVASSDKDFRRFSDYLKIFDPLAK